MDRTVLTEMLNVEDHHWWYCGRRGIIRGVLRRHPAPPGDILEIGCGGGGNLAMLSEFGRVQAVELDDAARAAAELRRGPVSKGWLPDGLPYGSGEKFARVALLDVIEHVADEEAALRRVHELLVPGGQVVISTPAYEWLWREQDDLNHHYRRHTKGSLCERLEGAGFETLLASYYNTLLFPVLAGTILANRAIGRAQNGDNRVPAAWLNAALKTIMGWERHIVPNVTLPFGGSLIVVARRKVA